MNNTVYRTVFASVQESIEYQTREIFKTYISEEGLAPNQLTDENINEIVELVETETDVYDMQFESIEGELVYFVDAAAVVDDYTQGSSLILLELVENLVNDWGYSWEKANDVTLLAWFILTTHLPGSVSSYVDIRALIAGFIKDYAA